MEDGSPEEIQLPYFILSSRAAMPFDVFLPLMVDLISNANRGIFDGGLQLYIVNTSNLFVGGGFHWITIAIKITND